MANRVRPIVINAGDMLQVASNFHFKSTTHRVVNPHGPEAKLPRFSMPLFLHPRKDVPLSDTLNAGEYLKQRLIEIGRTGRIERDERQPRAVHMIRGRTLRCQFCRRQHLWRERSRHPKFPPDRGQPIRQRAARIGERPHQQPRQPNSPRSDWSMWKWSACASL